MERHYDIRAWEIFLLVLKRGSISAVSEETLIEPSNLSRILSSLEASLGIKLIVRGKPVRLTKEGLRVVPLAEKFVSAHFEALKAKEAEKDDLSGVVRVGMPPAFFDRLLLPYFLDFSRNYPEIQIQTVDFRDVPPIVFEQSKEVLDLIIGFGPDELLDKPYQFCLGHCFRYPLASPTYLAKYGVPKSISDLSTHTLLKLQTALIKTGDYLIETGELNVVKKFGITISFSSPTSLKTATLLGGGIHHGMPTIYCYKELEKGDLIILDGLWSFPQKSYYLFSNKESAHKGRVVLVRNFLLKALKKEFEKCDRVLTEIGIDR